MGVVQDREGRRGVNQRARTPRALAKECGRRRQGRSGKEKEQRSRRWWSTKKRNVYRVCVHGVRVYTAAGESV